MASWRQEGCSGAGVLTEEDLADIPVSRRTWAIVEDLELKRLQIEVSEEIALVCVEDVGK